MPLDLSEVRELLNSHTSQENPYKVGKSYFIRGVTYHYVGRLVEITEKELVLEDAAWVADSGRFATALKSGELSEVEPYPNKVIINRTAIMDASLWPHDLPRSQK